MTSTVTSQTGRLWLKSHSPATEFENLASSTLPDAPAHRVEMEDLNAVEHEPLNNSARSAAATATATATATAAEPVFAAQEIYNQLHGTSGAPAVEHIDAIVVPRVEPTRSPSREHQIVFVNIPNVASARAIDDQADTNIVGVHDSDFSKSEEISAEAKPVQSESSEPPTSEIATLVDSILERFPLAASTVLLFVGAEGNPHVDETCARIASAIAAREIGPVLLVDADVEGQRLTRASGLVGETGFAECINRGHQWREKIVSRDDSSFGFLPVGSCEMDRWNAKQLLINSVAEIKQDYQFVCVAAGSAHSNHARLWYDLCEGSYLVVSLKSSNETIAKSSVSELKDGGARLLGCIVTDVE